MTKGLTEILRGRRNCPVAANSVTGIGVPNHKARERPSTMRRFFCAPSRAHTHVRSLWRAMRESLRARRCLVPVRQSRVARHPLRNAEVAVIQHTETAP